MEKKSKKRWLNLIILAAGGGIIFQLPYLRYAFYGQLQEALALNHEQYGNLLTVYALVAMVSYFPGGWLADRVSARKMLTFSFVSTGLAGFYFARFPSYSINILLHAFWGVSTILTYWAALMKLTRTLGDSDEQGRVYGLLEGGRGLTSTVAAYALLALYTNLGGGIFGISWVINSYAVLNVLFGLLTWFVVDDYKETEIKRTGRKITFAKDMLRVMKMPQVWLLCGVVFTTYSSFAVMTYTSPYLQTVFAISGTLAAGIAIFQRYVMQFLGGALGGIVADTIGSRTKVLLSGYIIILATLAVFLVMPGTQDMTLLCVANVLVMGITVYIMRGLYFAIIDELNVPLEITGTAIGFASLVGYLPDTFIYKMIGAWLDKYPGAQGYRYMFTFLLVVTIIGTGIMFGVMGFIKKQKKSAT
ncbi:MAG: MFS transporter [Oligoflexales bacterium]|nr:MFS transporter [Oligoflexales bacterium]